MDILFALSKDPLSLSRALSLSLCDRGSFSITYSDVFLLLLLLPLEMAINSRNRTMMMMMVKGEKFLQLVCSPSSSSK